MDKTKSLKGLFAVAVISSLMFAGCGSGNRVESVVGDLNSNNVIRVASCYALYQMNNGYRGPKNIKQLKEFLGKEEYVPNLEMMGVDVADIDAVFISERDSEEIQIRWGVVGSPRGCYEPVAFEKTGVDGSRRVGFANGVFEDIDDERTYDEMFAGKTKVGSERKKASVPKFDKNGNQIN